MKPQREHATNNSQTYMVTSSTWERRELSRNERWAKLLIDTLYHDRGTAYLLHEFVNMADHFHALITPQTSLEKAVQFIKGGFSYRAKKELGSNMEVWQKGFQDHRIRDANDYAVHVSYIRNNPVKERFCVRPDEFPYSSAHAGFDLDAVPQGLKPQILVELVAARLEGVPFQSSPFALLHHPHKILKQVVRIVWPRRGFGVVLHCEQRQIPVAHAFEGVVV